MTSRVAIASLFFAAALVSCGGGDVEAIDRIAFEAFLEDFAPNPADNPPPSTIAADAVQAEDGTTTVSLATLGRRGTCFVATVTWTVDWMFGDEPASVTPVTVGADSACAGLTDR